MEPEIEDGPCSAGEHEGERLVWEDENEAQYQCTVCGAEWFEKKTGGE